MTTPTPDDLARALNLAAERIAALTTERADLVRENEALHDVHDLLLKVEADNAALRGALMYLHQAYANKHSPQHRASALGEAAALLAGKG